MHGIERHRGAKGRINPGADGSIAGKARWLSEFGLEDRHLIGCQGRDFPSGHIDREETIETVGGIGGKPMGNRSATDAKQSRNGHA